MAYSGTKIETWNRSTPRDGLLLDSEFSQLYDDIENYISGNSGAEPPYTLKELADGTVTFAGAKTFSSKITGSISGDCDGNAGGYAAAIKETGTGVGTVRKRIIEIGDWDMNSTLSVNIAHGLTMSKIRNVHALIRNDADTKYTMFPGYIATSGNFIDKISLSSTEITLFRAPSSEFDSTDYDATSFNRGWITIEYVD